jgi:hypothetical protein
VIRITWYGHACFRRNGRHVDRDRPVHAGAGRARAGARTGRRRGDGSRSTPRTVRSDGAGSPVVFNALEARRPPHGDRRRRGGRGAGLEGSDRPDDRRPTRSTDRCSTASPSATWRRRHAVAESSSRRSAGESTCSSRSRAAGSRSRSRPRGRDRRAAAGRRRADALRDAVAPLRLRAGRRLRRIRRRAGRPTPSTLEARPVEATGQPASVLRPLLDPAGDVRVMAEGGWEIAIDSAWHGTALEGPARLVRARELGTGARPLRRLRPGR